MFYRLTSRNSRRSRRENGLFFASLLAAIVAFYMILSLAQQDVMLFLAKMESDAVNRLLLMIPAFYVLTLVLLFFLIYFASRYQLERRRHEFGVYLMMGMRRIKLFFMLLAEDFRSSLAALCMGLPIAVLLSELVSLITARLVGLGIIGHQFSLSWSAILWTAVGFLLIKLLAFLILSGRIAREEIGDLLTEQAQAGKKEHPYPVYLTAFAVGLVMLIVAYSMAISGMSWMQVGRMLLTLMFGLTGTLLLFYGLRAVLDKLARHSNKSKSLQSFTFRQLQENVIHRSNTLAISSLLILAALCCFGAGVAIAQHYGHSEQHTLDYTFPDSDEDEVEQALEAHNMENVFGDLFQMRVGYIRTTEDSNHAFELESVMDALRQLPASDDQETLLNNLSYATSPHLIALSDYNHLLTLAGEPEITLGEQELAVYMDTEFTSDTRSAMLDKIFAQRPEVTVDDQTFFLTGKVHSVSVVTDRSITLSFALILPDEDFSHFTMGEYSTYVNGVLSSQTLAGKSLMNAISDTNELLNQAGLHYESYLQNMGRQLFYVVAASYITIYLAIIFLVIANTVIGVQFLTSLQKTSRRYQTLIRLGATYQTLCQSARRQIRWYFGIPVVVAAISSIAGVRALFSGILAARTDQDMVQMMLLSLAMILLLCVVEYIYMSAVARASDRHILKLMIPEREE